jgi:stearoyl-CoA desaturase (Delta-9 desaturase)
VFLQTTGIQKADSLRFVRLGALGIHLGALGVFVVPYEHSLLALAAITFFVRTFAWEGGSHRYFAHRSYKTSRIFQLLLAMLAASGGQRGPICPGDPHSPVHNGFFYAHLGWILDARNIDTDLDAVKDLSRYPELVLVNKYHYVFAYLVLGSVFCIGEFTSVLGPGVNGLSAAVWGFFLSTLLSLHATLMINTFTHGWRLSPFNYRNFDTPDRSTNNWLLLIPTMGASFHNNHHRYMNAARAGFYWWEFDPTGAVLKVLEKIGVVWDLTPTPDNVLSEGRYTGAGRVTGE